MVENILKKCGITKDTKYHNYDYLYSSVVKILEMQAKINADQALRIVELENRLTKLQ